MVIDIIARIKGRQRQPRKGWWKVTGAQVLPQQLGPLDVIIAIIVATADCRSRVLQPPENDSDRDRAGHQVRGADSGFRFQPNRSRGFSLSLYNRRFANLFHSLVGRMPEGIKRSN